MRESSNTPTLDAFTHWLLEALAPPFGINPASRLSADLALGPLDLFELALELDASTQSSASMLERIRPDMTVRELYLEYLQLSSMPQT